MLGGGSVVAAEASDPASRDGASEVGSPSLEVVPLTAPGTPTPSARRSRRRTTKPATTPTPAAVQREGMERLLEEYEIRLSAHRRELLERENALEAAKRRIAELRKSVPQDAAFVPGPRDGRGSGSRAELPSPSPTPASSTRGDEALVSSLQHELDVERENRATLEREVQRLVSESSSPEELHALTQSLDGARAQVLLLNQRLTEEQRAREELEVTLERVRNVVGVAPGPDWMERFDATMRERRMQAERLRQELQNANEAIVQLKSRLETQGERASGTGPLSDSRALEDEVAKLREALRNAEQANSDLRAQSELASRLADLLYSQSR